ncbi:MAG: hypothetical protein WC238_06110 [Parcubacteria group bacterium]|jgi:hypothetical protein
MNTEEKAKIQEQIENNPNVQGYIIKGKSLIHRCCFDGMIKLKTPKDPDRHNIPFPYNTLFYCQVCQKVEYPILYEITHAPPEFIP